MSAAIHFYTAVTAGKNPAEGQVVRYDSVLCEEVGAPQVLKMAIQLRDDVHVDLETAAESDLAALDLMEGVPELDWARHAHSHFSIPQCLHVGLGNTTHADPFIRYSLYRNLLPYPCVGLPPNARSLDVDTIMRAVHLLRPEDFPWKDAPAPSTGSALHHFLMWDTKIVGGNRASRIREVLMELHAACPKLVEHAAKLSSIETIKSALGLDRGEVSDLESATPSLLCHQTILGQRGFILGLPVGVDITYPDILFVADLECDLTQLCDPTTESYQDLVRTHPREVTKPLVRISLNKFPFCAPLGVLRGQDASRLQVDITAVKANISRLRQATYLPARLKENPVLELASQPSDVYHRMWAGDFSKQDLALMEELHRSPESDWLVVASKASDGRFKDLVIRLVGRVAPQYLTSDQREECASYSRSRFPVDSNGPFWLAEQIKQAQDSALDTPAAVGLVQLHERLTRNIG